MPLEDSALVSIVITTFNRAGVVGRSVASALKQSYRNLEIIVVDDGSTDETPALLLRFAGDRRVRVIRHEHNRGALAAKNTGLDAVRGAYTTILDSDDELFPDAVVTLQQLLEELGPTYVMAFADCLDPETMTTTGFGLTGSQDVSYEDAICARFSGDFWGLWRTAAAQGQRFDERLPGYEGILWTQLYRQGKVRYLHRLLHYCHRGHPDRISSTYRNPSPDQSRGCALAHSIYLSLYGADLARLCSSRLAKLWMWKGYYEFLAGERAASWQSMLAGLKAERSVLTLLGVGLPLMPRSLLVRLFPTFLACRRTWLRRTQKSGSGFPT